MKKTIGAVVLALSLAACAQGPGAGEPRAGGASSEACPERTGAETTTLTRTLTVAETQFSPLQAKAPVIPLALADVVGTMAKSSNPCHALRTFRMPGAGEIPDEVGEKVETGFNDVLTPEQKKELEKRFLEGEGEGNVKPEAGATLVWREVELTFATIRTDVKSRGGEFGAGEEGEIVSEGVSPEALEAIHREHGVAEIDTVSVKGPEGERLVSDATYVGRSTFDPEELAAALERVKREGSDDKSIEVSVRKVVLRENRISDIEE